MKAYITCNMTADNNSDHQYLTVVYFSRVENSLIVDPSRLTSLNEQ